MLNTIQAYVEYNIYNTVITTEKDKQIKQNNIEHCESNKIINTKYRKFSTKYKI